MFVSKPPSRGLLLLLSVAFGCAGSPARPPQASSSATPAVSAPAPAGASQVGSAETSVRPGVNDKYFRPGALERYTDILEGESREVVRLRDRIVEALELRQGMVVGDIGAGTGLFALRLATAVGETGRVVANDIVPAFLDRIRERATAAGANNIETSLGKERDVALQAASLDLAFLCNVYHHLEYPVTYLASLRRALKPSGRLVVIDFERIEGETPPSMLKHVRAGKAVVIDEIARAGFELEREKDFLEENYFLVFRPVE